MKILIFGGNGMLGHMLVKRLSAEHDVRTAIRADFEKYAGIGLFEREKTFDRIDVETEGAAERVVFEIEPDVIINAVGIIKQLPSSKNVVKTLTVNSIFPHRLAEAAAKTGSRLITVSTDCVFDGKRGGYTEDDTPNATDLYGKSKNLGEVTGKNCLTIRTSIIGRELETAHSLVEWFLSQKGSKVKGYRNAIYTGFPTVVLSDIISRIIERHRELEGLYHVSSEPINKYDLLRLVREKFEVDIEIEPFDDFRIDRSLDCTKFKKETGFEPMDWESMIEKMAEDSEWYEEVRKTLSSAPQTENF